MTLSRKRGGTVPYVIAFTALLFAPSPPAMASYQECMIDHAQGEVRLAEFRKCILKPPETTRHTRALRLMFLPDGTKKEADSEIFVSYYLPSKTYLIIYSVASHNLEYAYFQLTHPARTPEPKISVRRELVRAPPEEIQKWVEAVFNGIQDSIKGLPAGEVGARPRLEVALHPTTYRVLFDRMGAQLSYAAHDSPYGSQSPLVAPMERIMREVLIRLRR